MNGNSDQPPASGRCRVIIHKARRVLELWVGGTLLAALPVALGRQPLEHKQQEGDGRTPEGQYHACVRNENSKYHLAIGLDYPNRQDAELGLAEGIISRGQFESIAAALDEGNRPPWDTALGGEIMIHGGGTRCDWTAGCIALDDASMDYLWEHITIGTEVSILP